jgi:hypothetical protein
MRWLDLLLFGVALLITSCSGDQPGVAPVKNPAKVPVDKTEAVRLILTWLTGEGRIPGFDEDYADAKWMKPGGKPCFLVCDFLPPGAHVTDNPKFHRISQADYDKDFREKPLEAVYRRGHYLRIVQEDGNEQDFTLFVSIMHNAKAGCDYRFVFGKDAQGSLSASGRLILIY